MNDGNPDARVPKLNADVAKADERHGGGLVVPRLRVVDPTPPPDMRPPPGSYPPPVPYPPGERPPAEMAHRVTTRIPGYPPRQALGAQPGEQPAPTTLAPPDTGISFGKVLFWGLAAFVGGWIFGKASSDADPLGNPEWETDPLNENADDDKGSGVSGAPKRRRKPAKRKSRRRKPVARLAQAPESAAPAEV